MFTLATRIIGLMGIILLVPFIALALEPDEILGSLRGSVTVTASDVAQAISPFLKEGEAASRALADLGRPNLEARIRIDGSSFIAESLKSASDLYDLGMPGARLDLVLESPDTSGCHHSSSLPS